MGTGLAIFLTDTRWDSKLLADKASLVAAVSRSFREGALVSKNKRKVVDQVSICLVEHHRLAARYLVEKLNRESGFHLLDSDELARNATQLKRKPVVFVIDHALLPVPLSEYLRGLRVSFPKGQYLILDKEVSEEELLRLLLLGIHGFVTYDNVTKGLAPAIWRVFAGGLWVPEAILQKYVDYSSKLIAAKGSRGRGLTRRESQVLELLRRRLSNKEIGEVLKVSEATVKFHLTHIFTKLQVHDRQSLLERSSQSLPTRGSLQLKPTPAL